MNKDVKKINVMDIAVWVLVFITMCVFDYSILSASSLEFKNLYGETIFLAYVELKKIQFVIGLVKIWYFICLAVFVLIRCNKISISKKILTKIVIALVIWSALLFVFRQAIMRFWEMDASILNVCDLYLKEWAIFLWLNHLVFLWFAYLLGKRKIGYISCFIGGIGCYVVAGLVIFSGNPILVGMAETIGFVFWGIMLFVGQKIHKPKLSEL